MRTLPRHLLSILLLPFVVVVVVPFSLLHASPAHTGVWNWLAGAFGMVILLAGLGLFSWCVLLFARVGGGTLAPWDPTRRLVAAGPYRHVRNPMISAVILMLMGEAVLWSSWRVGLWALAFFCLNHVYFVLSEEPGLEKRFGKAYLLYKAHVPRWIPRLRPWQGD